MKFPYTNIKGIKADIAKKEITIQLSVDFNPENIATCEDLSRYADPDAGTVAVEILPRQMALTLPAETAARVESVTLTHKSKSVELTK